MIQTLITISHPWSTLNKSMRSVIIRQHLAVPMFDFGYDLEFSGSYGLGTKARILESIRQPQYTAFKSITTPKRGGMMVTLKGSL
jgi:hypothetical protein